MARRARPMGVFVTILISDQGEIFSGPDSDKEKGHHEEVAERL
jgi:hypothetical protein